jgi:hypothetical protein
MSGAFYSFTAHVRLRNRVFTGCARQGLKQNRFMTEADLKNAEYSSEWSSIGKVRLKNGTYKEKIVPDSATELVIRIGNIFAFGDLDHDGVNEAVAILITDGGGSGTFYDLIVLKNCNGIPKHVATASLGDRVRIQSLSVQSGHILLEMIVHGPDDPMASPSLRMWKKYRLQEDQLMKVEND